MKITYGPYEPVRQVGNLVFISGQVGIDPATKQASSSVKEQTKQAIKNMSNLLSDHNISLQSVVKTTVYLVYMDDFSSMNEVYQDCFDAPRPTRACVGVADLPHISETPLLVEIEAVAYQESTNE